MSRTAHVVFLSAATAATIFAQPAPRGRDFPVEFSGCSEYVGTGPVSHARASLFVPAPFVAANDGSGNATLVVRAAQCASVKVENFPAESGSVAHIGVVVVPPDGTGDINNYTLAYATSSRRLAQRLERAGFAVLTDSDLVYEVTPNPPVTTSELYVEVSPESEAGWSITGAVQANAFLTIPFTANWWAKVREGSMKMSTAIPSIAFKPAQAKIITRRSTVLGQLLNANSYDQFGARPFDFNVRGEFALGQMSVTVR